MSPGRGGSSGIVAATVFVLLLLPGRAIGQRQVFIEGLATVTTALAGTDHADRVHLAAALQVMERGLAGWDREIEAAESRVATVSGGDRRAAFAARLTLAAAYAERGRLDQALGEIDAAARIDPRQPDVLLLQALVLDAAGRSGDAARSFVAAWRLDPADAVKAYYVVRYGGGDASDDDVRNARDVLERTQQALAGGERHESRGAAPFVRIELLSDGASQAPVLPYAADAEAFEALAHRNYEGAITAFREAIGRSDSGGERSRLARARGLLDAGREDDAERELRSIVTAFPRSGVAHWWLGLLYDRLNRAADARRELEMAAALAPLAGRAPLYAGIGRLARVEGDFTRAVHAFEDQVRARPNDAAARRHLAAIYTEVDRPAEAYAELVAALTIEPGDALAHAAIGRLLLDRGRHEEAVAALRRALELEPALHDGRYALGTALLRLGREDEGRRELEIFERARREALANRRQSIAHEVGRERAALGGEGDGR